MFKHSGIKIAEMNRVLFLKWLSLPLLLFLASEVQVTAGEMHNAKIKEPIDWICLTTAGGKDNLISYII